MKNQKVEKKEKTKKIYWYWLVICALLTVLSLWHQYYFYLLLLSPHVYLAKAIPGFLEISRLLSVWLWFGERFKLAIIAYISIALLSICINGLQFYNEAENKLLKTEAKIKKETAKNLESFRIIWQDLANKNIEKINEKIKFNRGHLKQNAGILEVNPENKKIRGLSTFEESEIKRLEAEKATIFKNQPKTADEYRHIIPMLAAEVRQKSTISPLQVSERGGNGESPSESNLGKSLKLKKWLEFTVLMILVMILEFLIFMTGKSSFPRVPKPSQKNPKTVKKNGRDSKKMFDEFMQHESCQKYLAACRDSEKYPKRDKYGLPYPGIKGISKDDSQKDGIVVRFRNLLRDNIKLLEVSK